MAMTVPPAEDVLPAEVVALIAEELGDRGSRVLACLRTARDLLGRAEDDSGLRLAESAAYNLREALDSVVAGRPPGEGGVAEVATAWKRYEVATMNGALEDPQALADLHAVIRRIARDEQRQSDRALKLLRYIQEHTGVDPLPGEADPIARFTNLLADANGVLHQNSTVAQVAALFDDTIAWLIRFFTPPDERIVALTSLAQRPYEPGLIDALNELTINGHHLRHFLTRLTGQSTALTGRRSKPRWRSVAGNTARTVSRPIASASASMALSASQALSAWSCGR